jgi:predicted phosphoadenosine phosphosulfate sulfurtransferase
MPMHLDNAASFTTRFLKCWDPDELANWILEKDPVSIKENYGANRLGELSAAIFDKEYAEHGINLR